MKKQELIKLIFNKSTQVQAGVIEPDKKYCTDYIERLFKEKNTETINHLAAKVVMWWRFSTVTNTWVDSNGYTIYQDNRTFLAHENPGYFCTDSNQFDELMISALQLGIRIDKRARFDQFRFYLTYRELSEIKDSKDNSAGVALILIGVIECVFAQVESTKESE